MGLGIGGGVGEKFPICHMVIIRKVVGVIY